MSKTTVVPPIVSALVAAEKILGKNRKWSAVNAKQNGFLKKFFAKRNELSKYSEKELRNWVSTVAAELNEILKAEGFSIELDEFKEGEFGVVSILDVLVEWLVAGEEAKIFESADGVLYPTCKKPTSYPAVRFKPWATAADGKSVVTFEAFSLAKHPHPVVLLNTKSGDRVGMTIAPGPAEGLELAKQIDAIHAKMKLDATEYEDVTFPMVSLDHEDDIGWLKGLLTVSKDKKEFEVSQAKQQTKFKMNQFGARVKSAVAIGIRTTSVHMPKPSIVINKPFFLWIERPGTKMPVMYAYLDQQDWKDPGDLKVI